MPKPLAGFQLGNPFARSTEADFLALVRRQCGALAVGTSTVGALLANDQTFQGQTGQLYRGELSNDEFLNAVLAAHPAGDANVPAVGCLVTALQTCLSGPCQSAPPPSQQAPAAAPPPAEQPTATPKPAPAPATDQTPKPLP